MKDDTKREKQYIISISSYLSLTELYDVEGGAHQQWVTPEFLGISDWKRYVFSYRFSLFEWKNTGVYFCVYVQYKATDEHGQDYSVSYTITRFRLNKDTTNNQISVKTVEKIKEEEINYDNRIVSALFLDKYDVFVVFFVKKDVFKFTLNFLSVNLTFLENFFKLSNFNFLSREILFILILFNLSYIFSLLVFVILSNSMASFFFLLLFKLYSLIVESLINSFALFIILLSLMTL